MTKAPAQDVYVSVPNMRDLRQTVIALSGIFAALAWIEIEAIDSGSVTENDQRDVAAMLVVAGELLCKGVIDRF